MQDLQVFAAQSDADAFAAAAAAVPLLSHESREIRFVAATALGWIPHAAAAPHLSTLLELEVTDGAYDEFHCVSGALWRLRVIEDDACVERLLEMLADAEPSPRCSAIYALTRRGFGSSAAHVAAVAAVLDRDDNSSGSHRPWQLAAHYLGRVGPLAEPHIGCLVRLLARSAADANAKRAAASSLVRLRDRLTETHVLSLVPLLACDEPAAHGGGSLSTRRSALIALSGVCEGREGCEEERTPLEQVEEEIGRGWRARRGELPRGVTAAVAAAVVALLEAEDEDSREVGARATGSLGTLVGEVDAVPALLARMAHDPCEDVVSAAADALVALAGLRGSPVGMDDLGQLRSLVREGEAEGERRAVAARVLGRWYALPWAWAIEGEAIGGDLAQLLGHEEAVVRAAALSALAAIGSSDACPEHSRAHIDAVGALLEDEAADVRVAAVGALAVLDAEGLWGDSLSGMLADRDPRVRAAAAAALKPEALRPQ